MTMFENLFSLEESRINFQQQKNLKPSSPYHPSLDLFPEQQMSEGQRCSPKFQPWADMLNLADTSSPFNDPFCLSVSTSQQDGKYRQIAYEDIDYQKLSIENNMISNNLKSDDCVQQQFAYEDIEFEDISKTDPFSQDSVIDQILLSQRQCKNRCDFSLQMMTAGENDKEPNKDDCFDQQNESYAKSQNSPYQNQVFIQKEPITLLQLQQEGPVVISNPQNLFNRSLSSKVSNTFPITQLLQQQQCSLQPYAYPNFSSQFIPGVAFNNNEWHAPNDTQMKINQQQLENKEQSNSNSKQKQKKATQKNKPIKKEKSKQPKEKKQYPDKNISRYMVRQIIQKLISPTDFMTEKQIIFQQEGVTLDTMRDYFYAKFEAFNNLQTLREHWNTDASDKSNLGKIKRVFRAFSKWFLEEKAIRYILNGRMKNKERYIHYKNKVMLYYINHPEKYNRNTRT